MRIYAYTYLFVCRYLNKYIYIYVYTWQLAAMSLLLDCGPATTNAADQPQHLQPSYATNPQWMQTKFGVNCS